MTDRDMTPAEARAEIEAFLGEGWTAKAWPCATSYEVTAESGGGLILHAYAPTYRAAVAALKQAWREAVRPWMDAAIDAKLDTADVDGCAPNERVIDRVCEKGMENV